MSDEYGVICGHYAEVPNARYEKDGKFYDYKKRLILPDGSVEEKPDEVVVKEKPPAVKMSEPVVEEFEELDVVDRIKIKSAASPGYLKRSEICKILDENGVHYDSKELRDDLLGRLKDSMGWTRPVDEISPPAEVDSEDEGAQ
jgi:hypothetical protein